MKTEKPEGLPVLRTNNPVPWIPPDADPAELTIFGWHLTASHSGDSWSGVDGSFRMDIQGDTTSGLFSSTLTYISPIGAPFKRVIIVESMNVGIVQAVKNLLKAAANYFMAPVPGIRHYRIHPAPECTGGEDAEKAKKAKKARKR